MKIFLFILNLFLTSCSSSLEMPEAPQSYVEKKPILLDVVFIENKIEFDEISASKDIHKLTSKIVEWSKKRLQPIGSSKLATLTIDDADLIMTQTDDGLLVKAFANLRFNIHDPNHKKLVDIKIFGEKSFKSKAETSSVEQESLKTILIKQLVCGLDEEFEKNLTAEELNQYIIIDHSQKHR